MLLLQDPCVRLSAPAASRALCPPLPRGAQARAGGSGAPFPPSPPGGGSSRSAAPAPPAPLRGMRRVGGGSGTRPGAGALRAGLYLRGGQSRSPPALPSAFRLLCLFFSDYLFPGAAPAPARCGTPRFAGLRFFRSERLLVSQHGTGAGALVEAAVVLRVLGRHPGDRWQSLPLPLEKLLPLLPGPGGVRSRAEGRYVTGLGTSRGPERFCCCGER